MRTYLMEAIIDLGVVDLGKYKARMGTYKCDVCNKFFDRIVSDMKELKTWSCKTCSNKSRATHGDTGTRLYNIYRDMKARCTVKTHKLYSKYGGAGVTIQSEWENSFIPFKEWALSNGYADDLVLDKDELSEALCISPHIYSEKTCRWATYSENNIFTRRATKSGYTGVIQEKNGKFNAIVRRKHIGVYVTAKEAAEARNKYIDDNNIKAMKS